MKTCAVCHEEVTPRQMREGAALSRGPDVVHRHCGRAARPEAVPAPLPGPATSPRPGRAPVPPAGAGGETSLPEIPEVVEYAGFWRRVGAQIIDTFILNVVVFFGAFVMGIGAGVTGLVEPSALTVLGGLFGGVVPVVYFVWFWARTGATPGKMALGLRVVAADDQPPTGMQSFIRFLGTIPSSLVFFLGYLWMLWDAERRCWHDILAGTRVIRV